MMKILNFWVCLLALALPGGLVLAGCTASSEPLSSNEQAQPAWADDDDDDDDEVAEALEGESDRELVRAILEAPPKRGVQLHLESTPRFEQVKPGSDSDRGRALFGVAEDLVNEDATEALFEGHSAVFGGEVISNGRSCFTCHRGENENFGMPEPPLDASIDLNDTLFTGINADAQNDPDAESNLKQLGLFKYKINRFNPTRPPSDPFKQVFAWRKSPALTNTAFSHGFLTDGRARVMFETARGAVFSHTQDTDNRFDDLFPVDAANDMEAFIFTIVSDSRLAALKDPSDPLHDTLIEKPYYTVDFQSKRQRQGAAVFHKYCFSCHNTPNVFSNIENVEPTGNGERPVNFPGFAPPVGRMFDVGVSQVNRHNLRFTQYLGDGQYAPIVLPLAKENGETVQYEVKFDIGLAATTGRVADIGRFKVPQLRKLADNAPYFHDNSAENLKQVIKFFNSPLYNNSRAGKRFPINMSKGEMRALYEFLLIL